MSLRDLSERPPPSDAPPSSVAAAHQNAERYTLCRMLGRGGMAVVHDATDVATGRRVALKRLLPQSDPRKRLRHVELFEREYHALAQLAHPNIVAVYGYGIDREGEYYAMELLDGGDLQTRAPLPWRDVCSIARDVCSALSLLHSRGLVHRDVSPRNVRCTQAGLAKLIDFGALSPFGPNKVVVGTAPCCAPETLHLQALDARTDLFSLGATLYYALVGHHAYAARDFAQLSDAWRGAFARPSELSPEIPAALEVLVLDLLRLDRDARPASASEVLERLSAIDGAQSESTQQAQAYLSMPTLIGRDALLRDVRRRLKLRSRGRGRTLSIEGAAGMGRSRFLDACMLDATLLGAACLRADAEDAASGDYGVLRALVRQLLRVLPIATIEATVPKRELLARIAPEMREAQGPHVVPAPHELQALRQQLQAAVVAWVKNLSEVVALVIAIDDVHRIDEPSAAVVSLLARAGLDAVHVLVSSEAGAGWVSAPARQVLRQVATRIELGPLDQEGSASLLRSLFGDVPHLTTLSHRLHSLTAGNPRDLLRLAQHLVDRGVVHYAAGAWTLPVEIDATDMPSSIAQALRARVGALGETARVLAGAFALCPDQYFHFETCAVLVERVPEEQLRRDLDELVAAQIVRRTENGFGLSKRSWVGPVRAALSPSVEQRLHLGLGQVLLERDQPLRATQHWLSAQQYSRALDVLLAHAVASQEQTAQSPLSFTRYALSLPTDWFETFDQALRLCDKLGRPKRDAFMLRGRLAGIVPAFGVADRGHTLVLLEQLKHYSGLRDWEQLAHVTDPGQRVERALAQAQARYDAAADDERVLDPGAARRMLARAVSAALGRVAIGLDVAYLRALPKLGGLAPISGAFALLDKLQAGADARYTGRTQHAQCIYAGLLSDLERAEDGQLEGSYREITRLAVMNALGAIEACMGRQSSLEWAERAAAHPVYQLNAVQTRSLYYLFQADVRSADTCQKQIETLRLQTLQLYESSHLCWELDAHAIAEDLTRMRHAIEQVASLAQRFSPWRAVQDYTAGEYHRIRHDFARALSMIEHALSLAAAGSHPLWASMASSHVRTLLDLGRSGPALEAARRYVATAQQHGLDHAAQQLWMVLALCQARARDLNAVATADGVLERLAQQGVSGLYLGLAHETRARVALAFADDAGFEQHFEACRDIYCRYSHPGLLAKCDRLAQDARRSVGVVPVRLLQTPDSYSSYTGLRLVTALEHCRGLSQRAKLALTILAKQSGADAGFLFVVADDDALQCVASVGDCVLPDSQLSRVNQYFRTQARRAVTTATHSQPPERSERGEWRDEHGRAYRPILLTHEVGGAQAVTGVALMAVGDVQAFYHPTQIAEAISRAWAGFDDTSLLMLGD